MDRYRSVAARLAVDDVCHVSVARHSGPALTEVFHTLSGEQRVLNETTGVHPAHELPLLAGCGPSAETAFDP